jgi:transposase-like protein
VTEEHLSGGTSLSELARRHDLSRELETSKNLAFLGLI